MVIPVPIGSLRETAPEKPTPVKNPEGKTLGTVYKTDHGLRHRPHRIRHSDSDALVPIAWADLTMTKKDGAVVLNTKQSQLEPFMASKVVYDRSPKVQELQRLVKELQEMIPPDLRAEEQRKKEQQTG